MTFKIYEKSINDFGTRPEAIKMAPLVKEFQKNIQMSLILKFV